MIDREKEKEKRKQKEEVHKKEIEKLTRCFNRIAETPDGQVLFRYIKNYSGYGKTAIVGNSDFSDINPIGTVYNEARKDVYYNLRQFIEVKNLKLIEFEEDENV